MVTIIPLPKEKLEESINLIFDLKLDTRAEIEHHLQEIDKHYIAIEDGTVQGVIGWYQDNIQYANEAMGDTFPGEDAYWVGFFGVRKDHQGRGIGSQLLRKIEEVVLALGATELWVSSVVASQSYYEQKGFKEISRGKIEGIMMVFLKKNL